MELQAIKLPLTYAATTLFEIDLAEIVGRVPAPLAPLEVRPGVGLVSLTVVAVAEGGVHGTHGALPGYAEAVFGIHVEPDLTGAVPDMAILVLCFAATDEQALAANADHHELNVLATPIDVEIDVAEHHMIVRDASGPIAQIDCAHPNPSYSERPATLQVFTATDRGLRRYDERFDLRSFRHQRRARAAKLHDHPLFCGVNVRGLERPFLQWLCEPGGAITQIASVPTRAVKG